MLAEDLPSGIIVFVLPSRSLVQQLRRHILWGPTFKKFNLDLLCLQLHSLVERECYLSILAGKRLT